MGRGPLDLTPRISTLAFAKVWATLGETTPSLDRDPTDTAPPVQRPWTHVTAAAIEAALVPLRGSIQQVPPVYSALRLGKRGRASEAARRGEVVELAARTVCVSELSLQSFDPPQLHLGTEERWTARGGRGKKEGTWPITSGVTCDVSEDGAMIVLSTLCCMQ